MADFYFRTEDIQLEDILNYFVNTGQDRQIINLLKSANPVILEGSRGTGKSFLICVAQAELNNSFNEDKILPVYITFVASSLIHTSDPEQFKHWMLAKISKQLIRSLRKKGILVGLSPATALLVKEDSHSESLENKFDKIVQAYEESYKNPGKLVSTDEIPDLIDFKDAVEEICQAHNISRICFFFDEAVHIFRPQQQRQFFTLFRDLRSPYITCNAAVYPGVTSYGRTFEMSHDATYQRIERDILSSEYLDSMKEIVLKQADENLIKSIETNMQNFHTIAYAANGNPRILLKTVARCPKMRTADVNSAIKTFYRSEIWAEHTGLGDKYKGHKPIVDWGRDFIENNVLPATKKKNDISSHENYAGATCYFWVHRDTPESVKEALRLLAYTGIVQKIDDAVRGSRSELGTRYGIKFGCLLAMETSPNTNGISIAKNLTITKFTQYGANHPVFQGLNIDIQHESDAELIKTLQSELQQPLEVLDLTNWQKNKLREINLITIYDVLQTTEEVMKSRLYQVGPVRARRMRNAAMAELLEYLSG
jgi:hypothetical protein